MQGFFEAGGWGMVPVAVLALLTVAAAVRHAVGRAGRRPAVALALGLATLVSGLLAFFQGMIGVFRVLAEVPEAQRHIVLTRGVAASLHGVMLALIGIMAALLIAGVGSVAVRRVPATTRG